MNTRKGTDFSAAELVVQSRIAVRESKAQLELLLASNEQWKGELAAARRNVAQAQAVLDEAIRVRDSDLRAGT